MKNKNKKIIISLLLILIACVAIFSLGKISEREKNIHELPECLQEFPFPKSKIETIEIEESRIEITGQIHRDLETTDEIKKYYENKDLKGWTYHFTISDHAVADGWFTLLFTK